MKAFETNVSIVSRVPDRWHRFWMNRLAGFQNQDNRRHPSGNTNRSSDNYHQGGRNHYSNSNQHHNTRNASDEYAENQPNEGETTR